MSIDFSFQGDENILELDHNCMAVNILKNL